MLSTKCCTSHKWKPGPGASEPILSLTDHNSLPRDPSCFSRGLEHPATEGVPTFSSTLRSSRRLMRLVSLFSWPSNLFFEQHFLVLFNQVDDTALISLEVYVKVLKSFYVPLISNFIFMWSSSFPSSSRTCFSTWVMDEIATPLYLLDILSQVIISTYLK